jgi:hypothetical protein
LLCASKGAPVTRRTIYLTVLILAAFSFAAARISPRFESLPTYCLVFVAPCAVLADWILRRRGVPGGKTISALVAINLFLCSPIAFAILFWGPQFVPPIAKHNSPSSTAWVRELLGQDVPIAETWYAEDNTFVGRAPRYLRFRFAWSDRAAVEQALRTRCTVGGELDSLRVPEAWLMKWDPPKAPVQPHTCGDYAVDFGASGDSLLFYEKGR